MSLSSRTVVVTSCSGNVVGSIGTSPLKNLEIQWLRSYPVPFRYVPVTSGKKIRSIELSTCGWALPEKKEPW